MSDEWKVVFVKTLKSRVVFVRTLVKIKLCLFK